MTAESVRRWLLGIAAVMSLPAPAVGDPVIAGKVVGIQDGDTLTLLDSSNTEQRIRLAGIDAPEKGQSYGQVAKQNLSAMAFGEFATADCPKVDRYARLVCVVRVAGTDLGLSQVRSGFAWHYKQYAHEQSAQDRESYVEAEVSAKAAGNGLWKDPQPIPPWEFRRSRRAPNRTSP